MCGRKDGRKEGGRFRQGGAGLAGRLGHWASSARRRGGSLCLVFGRRSSSGNLNWAWGDLWKVLEPEKSRGPRSSRASVGRETAWPNLSVEATRACGVSVREASAGGSPRGLPASPDLGCCYPQMYWPHTAGAEGSGTLSPRRAWVGRTGNNLIWNWPHATLSPEFKKMHKTTCRPKWVVVYSQNS